MTEKTIVLPPNVNGNGADANYRLTVMVPKRRYLSYLRNRWWVVMVCLALAVGGMVAYETLRQETYSSHAQLYLTLGPQLGTSIFAEPKDDFATQIELLKGARLGQAAMESLGSESTAQIKQSIVVDVVRPLQTSILQLRVTSLDANVSQKFLQGLIEQYLTFKKQTRLSTTEDLVASLNDELSAREISLKAAQEKWAEFQKTNNVPLIQEEAKVESLYLADLKMQLQKLVMERQLIEQGLAPARVVTSTNTSISVSATNLTAGATNLATSATNLVANATNVPPAPLASDTALKNARIDLTLRRAERDQVLNDRGEMAARPLDNEVHRLERTVAALESAEAIQREESLHESDKRIAAMQESMPAAETSVRIANDQLSQAQLIKDEIQRQQGYYDNLLGMLRNVDLNKNMAQERVTVLEAPSPGRPAERSLPLRVLLAVVGGFFLALGLVFVWYLFDDRLVSIHDLKDQFGETVLGMVPQVRVPKSKPGAALLEPGDTRAGYVESFRHLRSALLLSSIGEGRPQTLLFTGAVPAEGKTTIAVNLARMLAQGGMRVALVDADLRNGSLHKIFAKDGGPGLLDFLCGKAEAKAIIYPTESPGLSLVPAGAAREATDTLPDHPNLGELMNALKAEHDFVILDGAPILVADDTSLLVPHADAVVMVMRPFFTHARQARRALEMLYQRQARQVVLVMNRARPDDLAGEYYVRNGASHAAKKDKA